MYLENEYLNRYISSFFDMEKITSVSQIAHVFNGKRTPSMFYLIEARNWHHGFLLSNRLTKEVIQELVNELVKDHQIIEKDKGFVLTEQGQKNLRAYFDVHYYPQKIKGFSNALIRSSFWERFQLFTQVFSEFTYENSKYIPIVKDPNHQENVRQLFQSVQSNREHLLKQWINEQVFLFKNLPSEQANALANQLTGHNIIGKTRAQISTSHQMTQMEVSFYLMDAVEELIRIIRTNEDKLPLNKQILNILKNEKYLGLSESTYKSYELIKQGNSLEQVAHLRSIKVNTVREHVLEMAFILSEFPYKHFVPKDLYKKLHDAFSKHDEYSFKEALNEFEQLEFMHFRLVELERLRSK